MLRREKFGKRLLYWLALSFLGLLIVSLYSNKIDFRLCFLTNRTPMDYLNKEVGTDNYYEDIERSQFLPTNFDGSPNIEKILDTMRSIIKTQLWNYNFTYSGVKKLEDLLIESGGTPMRNIIISSWRSGSSFLGDLLNAVPSNFYYYEPLFIYGIKQIRGPPYAKKALNLIKSMLRCDYSNIEVENIFKLKNVDLIYSHQIRRNRILWDQCKYNTNSRAKFCKLFPFQTMKFVRLRLRLVKNLLEDTELNVRVVLLIRDPRAVMHSRLQERSFCATRSKYNKHLKPLEVPDCANPELLCADMISDYAAARRLSQEYPNRIMVLRFEDLVLNLNETTLQLLKFLRIDAAQSINEFLQTHTNVESTLPFSTFRVSRDVPFRWMKKMVFDDVEDIQDACKEAMKLWGYKAAYNASNMASKDFYPLKPYTL